MNSACTALLLGQLAQHRTVRDSRPIAMPLVNDDDNAMQHLQFIRRVRVPRPRNY